MGTTYYKIKAKKRHRKYTIKNNNKKRQNKQLMIRLTHHHVMIEHACPLGEFTQKS